MKTIDLINKNNIINLSKIIGYDFNNQDLLKTALTHKSSNINNNERLEFLGDVVLSLVCSEFLFSKSALKEGELSRLRANFVCQEYLSQQARLINLQDFIISEQAMRRSGGLCLPSVLSDTLEAIFAAVYLDGGLEASKKVIFKVLGEPSLELGETFKDFKTKLQEALQGSGKNPPFYITLSTTGPDHAPTFLVAVMLDGEQLAQASGENKKAAEQNAAQKALENIVD